MICDSLCLLLLIHFLPHIRFSYLRMCRYRGACHFAAAPLRRAAARQATGDPRENSPRKRDGRCFRRQNDDHDSRSQRPLDRSTRDAERTASGQRRLKSSWSASKPRESRWLGTAQAFEGTLVIWSYQQRAHDLARAISSDSAPAYPFRQCNPNELDGDRVVRRVTQGIKADLLTEHSPILGRNVPDQHEHGSTFCLRNRNILPDSVREECDHLLLSLGI